MRRSDFITLSIPFLPFQIAGISSSIIPFPYGNNNQKLALDLFSPSHPRTGDTALHWSVLNSRMNGGWTMKMTAKITIMRRSRGYFSN